VLQTEVTTAGMGLEGRVRQAMTDIDEMTGATTTGMAVVEVGVIVTTEVVATGAAIVGMIGGVTGEGTTEIIVEVAGRRQPGATRAVVMTPNCHERSKSCWKSLGTHAQFSFHSS
jgi:hypothetical protein